MPSKNSINRPKLTTNVRSKQQTLARKRDARERKGHFTLARSEEGSRSGEAKSAPVDLYFGRESPATRRAQPGRGGLTTKTLSKKRAKKIERNLKYAAQRRLLTDVQANAEGADDDEMSIDATGQAKAIARKQDIAAKKASKNSGSLVREALWKAIEDAGSQGLTLQTGNGTTLGGPFFP